MWVRLAEGGVTFDPKQDTAVKFELFSAEAERIAMVRFSGMNAQKTAVCQVEGWPSCLERHAAQVYGGVEESASKSWGSA